GSRSNVGCEQLDRLAHGHPATRSSRYDVGVRADLRLESFGCWATSADRIARALYNVDDACVPAIILTIVLKSTARSFGHLYGADGSSLGGPVGTARPRPINPNRSFRIDQTLSNRCAWFRCHGLDVAMGDCGVHLAAACPGESGPVASTRCSLDLGEDRKGVV